MARQVVTRWHTDTVPIDPAAAHDQAVTLLSFIDGVMAALVAGRPLVEDAPISTGR
jgi:hypothetical protein